MCVYVKCVLMFLPFHQPRASETKSGEKWSLLSALVFGLFIALAVFQERVGRNTRRKMRFICTERGLHTSRKGERECM